MCSAGKAGHGLPECLQPFAGETVVHPIPALVPAYQAGSTQYGQMLGDGGLADVQPPGDGIYAQRPVGQQIDLTFFNPFSHKHIDLAGQIIWSSAYAIGVKFNNLPRHRKDMISFFDETEVMNKKAG